MAVGDSERRKQHPEPLLSWLPNREKRKIDSVFRLQFIHNLLPHSNSCVVQILHCWHSSLSPETPVEVTKFLGRGHLVELLEELRVDFAQVVQVTRVRHTGIIPMRQGMGLLRARRVNIYRGV